jgi:dTDP-4-amino-4,6-dideoxygalactose transaminase
LPTTQPSANDTAFARSQPDFPFLDLKAEFATIRDEILAAVERVFATQEFILGPEVEALEREIARLVGCEFAVGCASGTDALLLSLMALGIGPGDEVITTPFTFVATAGSIVQSGARPVFVDINPHDFNIDPEQIARAVTAKTRAILPVHLFGLTADMNPIAEIAQANRLPVIEDAAQAIAARYHGKSAGSLGSAGCFSFFPSKNLGGAGDGGMITTQDPDLAGRLRVMRSHGSRKRYEYELLGTNSRLDALQAAVLRVKANHLKQWTSQRQNHAERYRALFTQAGLEDTVRVPFVPPGREHVYNQFVIRSSRRDQLREFLIQRGIPNEIYYPYPLHLQPAFSFLGYKAGDLPQAEMACQQVLALPICPTITDQQQQRVVEAIAAFFRQ